MMMAMAPTQSGESRLRTSWSASYKTDQLFGRCLAQEGELKQQIDELRQKRATLKSTTPAEDESGWRLKEEINILGHRIYGLRLALEQYRAYKDLLSRMQQDTLELTIDDWIFFFGQIHDPQDEE